MGQVLLLDCTLRDGGYTNNWMFGEKVISEFSKRMSKTGIDILEVGFIRNENNDNDRTVWNDIDKVSKSIMPMAEGVSYAVMAEMFNPLPIDKIAMHTEDNVPIIRVIVWKRLLKEGFEYCKQLIEKGYKVCIQPDRVNQYSYEEFRDMILWFNQISPYAIYVVDSNGLLDKTELMAYFKLANEFLDSNVKLGYHGHNNKLQAIGAAEALVEEQFDRDVMIDASIYGIGRSSGNLNIEIFAEYMNKHWGKKYDIREMLSLYDDFIKPIFQRTSWGYSVGTFITAFHGCNPNYANLFKEKRITVPQFYDFIENLSEQDKVIFNKELL